MNSPQLHTVLGASGAVGQAVIAELQTRKLPIRAVSRSVHIADVENVQANLLNPGEAKQAIQGSGYVYLCVGLPYDSKVWQRDWPILIQTVIEACAATDARLIFLDNVYMYGPAPLTVPFDETHSQAPTSKKGQVRKTTADLLLSAMESGTVKALIGRSADFYGPGAVFSPFYISFLERMLAGKAPQSIAVPNVTHTYAHVGDNGKALVALALDEKAYGQTWHLPVGPPITVEAMTGLFNQALGSNHRVSFLPNWLRGILSLFIQPLREMKEMMYQYDTPYVMNSQKFLAHFPDFEVTSYEQGVREMIDSFQKNEA